MPSSARPPRAPSISPPAPVDRLAVLLPLAHRIARAIARRVPRSLHDDVRAAAAIGAWQASTRFGAGTKDQLRAYATQRIRGAILDELRNHDWMPRRLRASKEQFSQFSLEEYIFAKDPIGGPRRGYPEPLVALATQEDDAQAVRDAEALRKALRRLTPRERLILAETYGRERLLQAVADELGVTEARVSQIRTLAIRRLQETMRARR